MQLFVARGEHCRCVACLDWYSDIVLIAGDIGHAGALLEAARLALAGARALTLGRSDEVLSEAESKSRLRWVTQQGTHKLSDRKKLFLWAPSVSDYGKFWRQPGCRAFPSFQSAPNVSVTRTCCSELPDGIIFTLGAKRFRCVELFRPTGLRAPRHECHHC